MQKPRMKSFEVLSIISLCLLIIPFLSSAAKTNKKNVVNFQVGVILDLNSTVGRIGTSCLLMAISDFYSVHSNYTTRIVLQFKDAKEVTDAAASGLHLLRDEGVDAIIGPQKSGQANFVINLGDKAHVPIISFSATNPFLPSKSRFFVQTAVSDDAQAGVIAAIVKNFQWNQVVMIYEDSDYGNGITSYLSNSLLDANARISYRSVIPISASDDFLHIELLKMMTMQTRVFVVHLSVPLATRFFLKAQELGMMNNGYVWIVSSSLMDLFSSLDSRVMEAMHGVIGVKPLVDTKSEKYNAFITRWKKEKPSANMNTYGLWAYDTLWALAMAAERVGIRNASTPMNTSDSNSTTNLFTFNVSNVGPELLKELSETSFDGLMGKFYLKNGKLGRPPFQILNVVEKEEIGILEVNENENSSGTTHGPTLKVLKSITWPGNSTIVPKGWVIPVSGKMLRVGVPAISGFDEFCKVEIDPQTNATHFSGYYVDLFNLIMQSLPYAVRYEFVQFKDPNYTALVEQVSLQNYDAVVGDITITAKRSDLVDFTLPIAEGGFVAIVPTSTKDIKWGFLAPFTRKLWLTSLGFPIYTGFAVWFLEHRINNNFRGSFRDQLGKLLFYPFMTIVFAHREKIVGNLTRMVVMVWVFVVLILTSTYMASLSAILTVRPPYPSATNVSELKRTGTYIGCRNGSFMLEHLKKLGFNESKIRPCQDPDQCNKYLTLGSQKGGVSAFFGVVPYIKLFLLKYSNKYMTIDQIYRTEGYAFAFPKGSPLVADVSRAITELTEKGKISEIEQQWSNLTYIGAAAANITLTNVKLGSFKALFTITGSVTTVCLILFFANYFYENRVFIMDRLTSSTSFWTKIHEIWSHFNEMEEGIVSRRYQDTPDPSPRAFIDRSSQIHPLNTNTGSYLRSRSTPNATP